MAASHGADLASLLASVPCLLELALGLSDELALLDTITANPPGADDAEREESRAWAQALAEGVRSCRPGCIELLARLELMRGIATEML